MKYYKIKQNRTIIDALADPLFIVYQEGNDMVLVGSEHNAFGVLSYDSSVIYAVEGMKPAPTGEGHNYAVVQMEPIGAEEYEQLRDELDAGTEPPDEPEQEDQGGHEESAMSLQEIRLAITALQEENARLVEQNVFLQDCLMEMADEVYK
jgi:hypothetical protein